MLTIINAAITLIGSVVLLTKQSIFAFFSGLYSYTKISLGIAVPLAAI